MSSHAGSANILLTEPSLLKAFENFGLFIVCALASLCAFRQVVHFSHTWESEETPVPITTSHFVWDSVSFVLPLLSARPGGPWAPGDPLPLWECCEYRPCYPGFCVILGSDSVPHTYTVCVFTSSPPHPLHLPFCHVPSHGHRPHLRAVSTLIV